MLDIMYVCIYVERVLIYCSVLERASDTLKKPTLKNAEESNETELAM